MHTPRPDRPAAPHAARDPDAFAERVIHTVGESPTYRHPLHGSTPPTGPLDAGASSGSTTPGLIDLLYDQSQTT